MTENYKTLSGVPIPPVDRRRKSPRKHKYPVATMPVGDSFFLEDRQIRQVSAYMSRVGSKLGRTFTTRRDWSFFDHAAQVWRPCEAGDQGAREGVRVWRTA